MFINETTNLATTHMHTNKHIHLFIHIPPGCVGLLKFALTGNWVKNWCYTASNINTSNWCHIIIYLQLEYDSCIIDTYPFNFLGSFCGVKGNPWSWASRKVCIRGSSKGEP